MNFPGRRRKFTLMYIPEASGRTKQIGLPHFLFHLLPSLAVACLLALILWIYSMKTHSADAIRALNRQYTQLNDRSNHEQYAYAETIKDKDNTINGLQNQVVALSAQAEDIQAKLQELEALESEISQISQKVDPAATSAAKSDTTNEVSALGVGGPLDELSEQEVLRLATDTQLSYGELDEDMASLSGRLDELKRQLLEKLQIMDMTPSIWPTASHTISSGFGSRKDPFTEKAAYHAGIDIAANLGDPVKATAAGVVRTTGKDSLHGNYIEITHTAGLATIYMHLSKILVNSGDAVKKEDIIGLVGSTGRSTGPHLHYEVTKNGNPVNPKPYLQTN